MEEKMIKIDLGRCLKAIAQKWYLSIGIGVVVALITYALIYDTPQYYYATASIYSSANGSYTETAQGVTAMQLYAEIIDSQKIAERAVSIMSDNSLDVREVQRMASATHTSNSPVIYINAKSTNPNVVITTANALATSLVIEAQSITGTQAIQILDEASSVKMMDRGVLQKVAIAFLGGMIVVIAIIFLVEIVTDRVYRVEDAGLDGKLEIIGIIPDQRIN